MPVATTVAHFAYDDPDELVAAAFSCHWCLASARDLWLEFDGLGGEAASRCPACDKTSFVLLEDEHLRRLGYAPPHGLSVHLGDDSSKDDT